MRPSSDVPVIDIIEMKHGRMPDPEVSIGRVATIRHQDGRALTAEVEGVRGGRGRMA